MHKHATHTDTHEDRQMHTEKHNNYMSKLPTYYASVIYAPCYTKQLKQQ